MMQEAEGVIVRGLGGLYTVLARDEKQESYVPCRARGAFRHENLSPAVGDRVRLVRGDEDGRSEDGVIEEIFPRKNLLIRPPVANLDTLFVVLSVTRPVTVSLTADKLIASAEHYDVEPVIIITKAALDPDAATELERVYRTSGFTVFVTDSREDRGTEAVRCYIAEEAAGGISALAGVSGAGKSTLINALFPSLTLRTGDVSRKTGRGRHTTRAVELYPLSDLGYPGAAGFLADTPGFSALDFLHFDFFELDELAANFREFAPYLGECRYKKCTHLCEDGCAIVEATANGLIPQSRHDSYRAIYAELKQRHSWDKKN